MRPSMRLMSDFLNDLIDYTVLFFPFFFLLIFFLVWFGAYALVDNVVFVYVIRFNFFLCVHIGLFSIIFLSSVFLSFLFFYCVSQSHIRIIICIYLPL